MDLLVVTGEMGIDGVREVRSGNGDDANMVMSGMVGYIGDWD